MGTQEAPPDTERDDRGAMRRHGTRANSTDECTQDETLQKKVKKETQKGKEIHRGGCADT
jgi:hypothetical protein